MGFLSDAIGTFTGGNARDAAQAAAAGNRRAIERLDAAGNLATDDLQPFADQATGDGGSLELLRQGIDGAPAAPELQEFNFDPNSALDNPNFQFIRDQGNQAGDRIAAKNRNLGSGERLLAAQRFGQGNASNFLNSEFSQQRTINNDNNNRLLAQYNIGNNAFNDRLNRLSGLVNTGFSASNNIANNRLRTAGATAGRETAIGENRAAGIIGVNNAVSSTINQAAGAAGGGGFFS